MAEKLKEGDAIEIGPAVSVLWSAGVAADKVREGKEQLVLLRKDIEGAKKIARAHGFAWGEDETVKGAVRNILAVLIGERDLHAREVKKLPKERV